MEKMAKKRSIFLAFFFSIITFGIYWLYWYVSLTNDLNKISKIKTAGGFKALVFTCLTCGIYSYYWYYMTGKKIKEYDNSSSGFLHLVLGFFGLGFISWIIAQKAVNRFAVAQQAEANAAAKEAAKQAAETASTREGKTGYDVILTDIGRKKIEVIKIVREHTGLGLAEAKQAVENLGVIKENMSQEEAEEMVARLLACGATAEYR